MRAFSPRSNALSRPNSWGYALAVGALIGMSAGLLSLLLALAGPIIAAGVVVGLLAGVYVLSNVSAALYGIIFVMMLLPFGTLPFRIGFTPTFLDIAMGTFVFVYLAQWMTGRRHSFRFTPVHALIGLYILWLLLCFALGLRYAMPTSTILRQFAETLISISLVFILVDLLRDKTALRRLVLVVMVAIALQALAAIILVMLPDDLTERTLIRLARFGYPNGGVIRYIEDNPALAERAIGTWVDPNALGGILAIAASMIAPQLFTRRPVLRYRGLTVALLGIVTLALVLTFSRASMLGFAIGVAFIGLFPGYRRYLTILIVGLALMLALPQTRSYVERFAQAFTASDLATQMRLGEYSDSLELISQHPIVGVGFTGTPSIDLYTNVASLYLIMANQIGLVGVALFLVTIGAVFLYGWHTRQSARGQPELESIHLGYHAALLTALINATADLYFFRLDFHASITMFWLTVALALSSSRLAVEGRDSTVAESP
jgi:O-antigen ligase